MPKGLFGEWVEPCLTEYTDLLPCPSISSSRRLLPIPIGAKEEALVNSIEFARPKTWWRYVYIRVYHVCSSLSYTVLYRICVLLCQCFNVYVEHVGQVGSGQARSFIGQLGSVWWTGLIVGLSTHFLLGLCCRDGWPDGIGVVRILFVLDGFDWLLALSPSVHWPTLSYQDQMCSKLTCFWCNSSSTWCKIITCISLDWLSDLSCS